MVLLRVPGACLSIDFVSELLTSSVREPDAAICATSFVLVLVSAWAISGFSGSETKTAIARAAVRTADAFTPLLACLRGLLSRVAGESGEPAVDKGDVAEMVDIVRLGLTAGLSFDAALELYCSSRTGRLSEAFARARLMWQSGAEVRRDALMGAARDLGERSLESFSIAVTQALELGAPLADTLAAQSRELRAAHRAEVERRIERAPVKLLIPTGTLILPALLISIMGPLLAASGMV